MRTLTFVSLNLISVFIFDRADVFKISTSYWEIVRRTLDLSEI